MALVTCVTAHHGQRDRDGKPHYIHAVRVALQQKTPDRVVIALLHDMVEDTDSTLDEIERDFGFRIAVSVHALSRGEDEPYRQYIRRVCDDQDAVHVKIADIKDNIRRADEKFRAKLPMYEWALKLLESKKDEFDSYESFTTIRP